MKRAILVAAAMLGATAAASAKWAGEEYVDPMTDITSVGAWVGADHGRDTFFFKCWAKPGTPEMIAWFDPDLRFDYSAQYSRSIPIKIRFDQGQIHELTAMPVDTGGDLTFEIVEPDDTKKALMREAAEAKSRMAIAIGPVTNTFSAKGSQSSIARMDRVCGLKLFEESAAEAAPSSPPAQ